MPLVHTPSGKLASCSGNGALSDPTSPIVSCTDCIVDNPGNDCYQVGPLAGQNCGSAGGSGISWNGPWNLVKDPSDSGTGAEVEAGPLLYRPVNWFTDCEFPFGTFLDQNMNRPFAWILPFNMLRMKVGAVKIIKNPFLAPCPGPGCHGCGSWSGNLNLACGNGIPPGPSITLGYIFGYELDILGSGVMNAVVGNSTNYSPAGGALGIGYSDFNDIVIEYDLNHSGVFPDSFVQKIYYGMNLDPNNLQPGDLQFIGQFDDDKNNLTASGFSCIGSKINWLEISFYKY